MKNKNLVDRKLFLFSMGLSAAIVTGIGIRDTLRESRNKSSSSIENKVNNLRVDSTIRLYDLKPSFNASIEDLGVIVRSYVDHNAVLNYSNNQKIEDVNVEERDVNGDGKWDIITYLSQSENGHWPVIGLNPKSVAYHGLLKKFGSTVEPSSHAIAGFYRK